MPLVQVLQRASVAAPFGLIALCAYFQARGATALLAAAWAGPPPVTATRAPPHAAPARPKRSASAIIEKNPFDTSTALVETKAAEPEPAPVTDPLRAPKCEDVFVYITTEANDPRDSVAIVQGPSDKEGIFRGVGDPVGDRKIAYIGRNPLKYGPAVWLYSKEEGLCQSLLFDGTPRQHVAKRTTKRAKPARRTKRRVARRSPALPPDIAKKIQRVSPTSFRVERSAVDQIMEQYGKLMHGVRVVPKQQDGHVVGLQVVRVRHGTLLDRLGVKNGDRIDTINGFSLSSPEKALQAYARLRTASHIQVQVQRRGKPMTLDYQVQ